MQSTAVQIKTCSSQSVERETTETAGSKKDTAEFTDPFLQIIMSLLTQTLDQSTQQTDATESPVISDESSRLSEVAALLGNSAAGMTALLNLMINSGSEASDAAAANTAGSGITEKAEAADILSGLAAETGVSTAIVSCKAGTAADLTDLLSLFGRSADKAETVAISSDALTQITDLLGTNSKDEMKSLLKNAGIEVISGKSALAQDGFTEAVTKAKQMLSEYLSQNTDNQDDIDVDKLQNGLVKTETETPFELKLRSAGGTADASVLEQLTGEIKQNVSLGKSEFTIKLKPETLGEITVKLVEEAGKTTLTITTASAQTAKLINNDLAALKEAVAPMNVDVRDAVVSTNETAGGSMQQFEMSGQQFAEQQFAGQQSLFRMTQTESGQNDELTTEDNAASSQAARVKAFSGDRLDAYI